MHHAQSVEPKLIATDVHHAGHTCRSSIASEFATCLVSSDASAAATTAPAVAGDYTCLRVERLREQPGENFVFDSGETRSARREH